MIETVYMKDITQVGMSSSGENLRMKVYFEQKVMQKIKQDTVDGNIRYGILLGSREYNNDEYVYVKESVEVPYKNENIILFNDDTWLKVYELIKEKNIQGEIVGWYVVNPEGREKGGQSYKRFHLDNFAGVNKLLFVRNEKNEDESLYIYERDEMVRQSVYYMYSDKSVKPTANVKREGMRQVFAKSSASNNSSSNNKSSSAGKQRSTKSYGYAAVIIALVAVIVYMVNGGMFDGLANRAKNAINGVDKQTNDKEITKDSIYIRDVDGDVTSQQDNTTKPSDTTTPQDNTTSPQDSTTTTKENETTPTGENITTVDDVTTKPQEEVDANVYETYIVGTGETLYDICRKKYGDYKNIKKIVEINKIENADKIYAGQKLLLP